jgi:hypothetical protein
LVDHSPRTGSPSALGLVLDGLEDLGRRRAGVGIGRADAGVDGAARHGFVTQQDLLVGDNDGGGGRG